jgi:hypothetical protein
VQPCEAAYLSSIDPIRGGDAVPPQVTVLVVCVPIPQRTNSVLMEGQTEQRLQNATDLLGASERDCCTPSLCSRGHKR